MPANLAEAGEFYAAYVRRNNTMAADNPYGVTLTKDNLAMMKGLLPPITRLFGLGFAPSVCMTELLSSEELARVGKRAGDRATGCLRAILTLVLRAGQWTGHQDTLAAHLAHLLMQGMVAVDRRGEVEFSVPFSRLDLRGPAFE